MIRQYTTVNTFTRGPVAAQIVTYLVFLGEALTFFICMYVNFASTVRQITILVLYIVTMIVQVYLTVVTSCSDPSDSLMIDYRNNPKGRNNFNIENCLYCEVCASYVKQTSRHCKVCQRCVQNFDHHCMWVNNCVGSKNYNYFLSMTVMTLINLLIYVAGMILLWTEGQWKNYLGSMVTLWVYSFIVVIISVMLLNLIGLHVYLIYKGLTTYQFIILQREEQRQKKQDEQNKERQSKLQKNREIMMVSVKSKKPSIHNVVIETQQRQPPAIQQVEIISQQVIKNHQNSADVIFGQPNHQLQDENDQKTQKSSYISRRNQQIQHQTLQTGQNLHQQNQEPGSLSSKRQIKDNISEFFTKNKSLKFFIGDQIGSRPHQTNRVKTLNVKQKLYQSARPADNIMKQLNIVRSDGKNLNQYVSARK